MGIYRRFVGGAQLLNKVPERPPSKKIFTPPTAMTATRVPLAVAAANKLVKGEKYATPYVALMALSDAEGNLARFIDKVWPKSGLGCSELGAPADTVADTLGILVVAGAVLRAPHVTKVAKLATVAVLGQEGTKSAWYIGASNRYKAATVSEEHPKGEKLILPVSLEGKEAMVEKFGAIFFAVATNDTDNRLLRAAFSGLAAGHAASGSIRGEHVRQGYEHMLEDTLGELALGPETESGLIVPSYIPEN